MQIPGNTSHRFSELDSLRGLAAGSVVLGHFWSGLGAQRYLEAWNSPLRLLIAGHDAVILFFVLSGFVLTLPYEQSKELSYSKFIVRRICRIYLPYLGALFLAVALNFHYHGLVTADGWTNQTWNQRPNSHLIIQHVVFLGNYNWAAFNTAFWSLVYEMRISLIFPFIAIAALRAWNWWMLSFAICASLLSDHHSVFWLFHLGAVAIPYADTLHYMSFLILGALLAKNRELIRARYGKLPLIVVLPLFGLALLFYYHPVNIPEATARILAPRKISDWSVAIGSFITIALAFCSGPFKNLLNRRVLVYLGKISYSVYLVHGTVLYTLLYMFRGHLEYIYLPIYLIAVLGLACIFYYLIEKPSIVLGQKLVKRKPRNLRFFPHNPVARTVARWRSLTRVRFHIRTARP